MARPRKHRCLSRRYQGKIFKPVGVGIMDEQPVTLLPEELEALKLAEVEGLYQAEACEAMGVARSTFQRILADARRKITVALTENKALFVSACSGRRGIRIRWKCYNCGESWRESYYDVYREPEKCPYCASRAIRESQRRRRDSKRAAKKEPS
jgi:predicted DNA-binding protein (UPF0251 family)